MMTDELPLRKSGHTLNHVPGISTDGAFPSLPSAFLHFASQIRQVEPMSILQMRKQLQNVGFMSQAQRSLNNCLMLERCPVQAVAQPGLLND